MISCSGYFVNGDIQKFQKTLPSAGTFLLRSGRTSSWITLTRFCCRIYSYDILYDTTVPTYSIEYYKSMLFSII